MTILEEIVGVKETEIEVATEIVDVKETEIVVESREEEMKTW
jgi:copper chaperone CopZ